MSCAVIILFISTSCIYFINLSMIIVIISHSWDSGSGLTKSTIIYSYSLLGVFSDYIFS